MITSQEPLVTVVTPYGYAHRDHVSVAAASVLNQTLMPLAWRLVIVDDTASDQPFNTIPDIIKYDSRVKLIRSGGVRSAKARNLGLAEVTTPFVVFLDADDYLLPGGLYRLLAEHLRHDKSYTFSSHVELLVDRTEIAHLRPPPYSQADYGIFNIHTITALVTTADAKAVGGFDENAPGWEDWTLWLKLAQAGHCGHYSEGPVFVYRADQSVNHPSDIAGGKELMDRVIAPYLDQQGRFNYMACGCSSGAAEARSAIRNSGIVNAVDYNDSAKLADDPTRQLWNLEFTGPQQGTQQWIINGRTYRAGNTSLWRELVNVPREDATYLLSIKGAFRLKQVPVAFVEPPSVEVLANRMEAETTSVAEKLTATIAQERPLKNAH